LTIWIVLRSYLTFDYVIFADVLEHLRDPLEVLKRTKKYLNENGSVLISVPNIAHNAVIHGAKIASNVLIGIGAIILDHTEIGSNSIIAAGSVVLSNSKIEPGSVWGGNPAKKLKDIEPAQSSEMINKIASNYLMYSEWYKE